MSAPTPATPKDPRPIKHLILDSGPLLSLTPLRHLSPHLLLPPSLLPELRDPRARTHYQSLLSLPDVRVEVRQPDALSMQAVIRWAKHTGDYAVLSKVDLEVLGLTMMLEVEENGYMRVRDEPGKPPKGTKPARLLSPSPPSSSPVPSSSSSNPTPTATSQPTPSQPSAGPSKPSPWATLSKPAPVAAEAEEEFTEEDYPSLGQMAEELSLEDAPAPSILSAPVRAVKPPSAVASPTPAEPAEEVEEEQEEQPFIPIYDDEDAALLPSDGEGEWITPSNVAAHKSVDLGLIPASASAPSTAIPASSSALPSLAPTSSSAAVEGKPPKTKGPKQIPQLKAACMSGDYAVQNVLLQMGLNLVGEGGGRIGMVKSWVGRCYGCFKICKDSSKKFCPSCGNATLIRASVTTTAAGPASTSGGDDLVKVHLKPNFQYKTRGSVFPIPAPKMGSAKGQSAGGSGLILREDQKEYQTALKRVEGRQAKDDRRLQKAVEAQEQGRGGGGGVGGWNDPDWEAEMLVVGLSGKGRRGEGVQGEMPRVGWGRGNPNQVRKGRK